MFDRPDGSTPDGGRWLSNLSPRQQIGYGCLLIMVIGASVMYCAGTVSLAARPMLLQRATATEIVAPTLRPTPSAAAQPTFLSLPTGVLLSTPTQAPIPTREPRTITPTVDLTNPAPTEELTPPSDKTATIPSQHSTESPTPQP